MNIIQFLFANWDSVLVILAFLALIVVLVKRGETKVLNKVLFSLVTQAEKQFGGGTGKLKLAAVSDWIYQRIPAVLKLLFSEKDIENMIETALAEAKKAWGNNENIAAYIELEAEVFILPTQQEAQELSAERTPKNLKRPIRTSSDTTKARRDFAPAGFLCWRAVFSRPVRMCTTHLH